MMDSDVRRQALIVAAFGFATMACICIALADWLRSGVSNALVASCVLSVLSFLAFLFMCVRYAKIRSRVGKAEVSFISIKDGVPKKEPPVHGKRPPVR